MKKIRALSLLVCAVMLLAQLQFTVVFAAETEPIVVKNIFTDSAASGVSISSWSVASPTAVDTSFKKVGTASLKIQYKASTNQSTSAFYFSNCNIASVRETGTLQFWYYSEMDINQINVTLKNGDIENRVPIKSNYLTSADVGKWTLIQIPLTAFSDRGIMWDGSKFVDAGSDFDFDAIDSLVLYGSTTGITDVKPVYIDEMCIVDNQEIVIQDPVSYYVSPSGNDNNSGLSPDKALKTPQKAADKTNPGDTVYFMGGTYENYERSILSIKRSGKEGAYITYTNYNNEKPVFKSGYNAWDAVVIKAQYIIFDGLTLEGINGDIPFEEGFTEGFEAYNAVIKNQDDSSVPVDWVKIGKVNTNGISINGRDATANGTPRPHHVVIRNCEISDFPAAGVASLDTDYLTVENNIIHDNMYYSLYGSSGISLLGSVDVDNNTTGYKNIIRNNVVYGNINWVKCQNGRKWSDGNGIIIDYNKNTSNDKKDPYQGRTLVENNIVYENGGGGIHVFYSNNVDVINNTCYDNGQASYANGLRDYENDASGPNDPKTDLTHWGNISVSRATNVRVINNIAVSVRPGTTPISYDDHNGKDEYKSVIYANNVYYNMSNPNNLASGNGSNALKAGKGFNNVWANPEFVDPENGDFRLKASSPAIDAGIDTDAPVIDLVGASRPQGARNDLGAYESSYSGAEYTDVIYEYQVYPTNYPAGADTADQWYTNKISEKNNATLGYTDDISGNYKHENDKTVKITLPLSTTQEKNIVRFINSAAGGAGKDWTDNSDTGKKFLEFDICAPSLNDNLMAVVSFNGDFSGNSLAGKKLNLTKADEWVHVSIPFSDFVDYTSTGTVNFSDVKGIGFAIDPKSTAQSAGAYDIYVANMNVVGLDLEEVIEEPVEIQGFTFRKLFDDAVNMEADGTNGTYGKDIFEGDATSTENAFSGEKSIKLSFKEGLNPGSQYLEFMLKNRDMTGFAENGYLKFKINSSVSGAAPVSVTMKCADNGKYTLKTIIQPTVNKKDTWQTVVIPMSDFGSATTYWDGGSKDGPAFDWSTVYSIVFRPSTGYAVGSTVYLDDIELCTSEEVDAYLYSEAKGTTALTSLAKDVVVRATAIIGNEKETNINPVIILALYDDEGALKNLWSKPVPVAPGKAVGNSVSATLGAVEGGYSGYSVKAFVWESFGNITPMDGEITFKQQ